MKVKFSASITRISGQQGNHLDLIRGGEVDLQPGCSLEAHSIA